MLEILCHPHLPHKLVLIPVHPHQCANMRIRFIEAHQQARMRLHCQDKIGPAHQQ